MRTLTGAGRAGMSGTRRPVTAERSSDPLMIMSATEMRILEVVRGLTPLQADAWLRMGQRIVDGMPIAEAKTLFEREIGGHAHGSRP
jgi:hypothetical protein